MPDLFNHYRCGLERGAWSALRSWYDQSPLGRQWYEAERAALEPVLSNLFGYHLLQVGRPTDGELYAASRMSHRMVIDLDPFDPPAGGTPERCVAEHHQLPMLSDSLDLVLLPHTLELTAHPHEVLREAERTLIPEGHVVILGFNPLGIWGLQRLLAGWRGKVPWCSHFYTPTRVRDWLALLGFDTVLARGFFYRPPLRSRRFMARLEFMERARRRKGLLLAGGYLMVAKKRVATLTPIRPRWRPRRSLVANGLAKPTMNHRSR